MNKIQQIKTNITTHAPAFAAGVATGGAVVATLAIRRYHPAGQVAMQFPKGLTAVLQSGTTVVCKSNIGDITMQIIPNS